MAIDTQQKRASALLIGLPFRGLLPLPDVAAETQADRQQLLNLYAGILASAPVVPPAPSPTVETPRAIGGLWTSPRLPELVFQHKPRVEALEIRLEITARPHVEVGAEMQALRVALDFRARTRIEAKCELVALNWPSIEVQSHTYCPSVDIGETVECLQEQVARLEARLERYHREAEEFAALGLMVRN